MRLRKLDKMIYALLRREGGWLSSLDILRRVREFRNNVAKWMVDVAIGRLMSLRLVVAKKEGKTVLFRAVSPPRIEEIDEVSRCLICGGPAKRPVRRLRFEGGEVVICSTRCLYEFLRSVEELAEEVWL